MEITQLHSFLHFHFETQVIHGKTELFISPKSNTLESIRLHSRQCDIQKITINDMECTFEQLVFLEKIVDENYVDGEAFDLFYRGSLVAAKEGELIIQMPEGLKIEQENLEDGKVESEVEDVWDVEKMPSSSTEYKVLVVRIEYVLEKPRGGVRFVMPDEYHVNRSPHAYSYTGALGGLCDGIRTWMPCRDALDERCRYRMELNVPAEFMAISGGTLAENSMVGNRRIFRYVVNTPTTACSIGFAIGPFQVYIPKNLKTLAHFALPECFDMLEHSVGQLENAIEYIQQYLNCKYPYNTYQQIFVDEQESAMQWLAGMTIVNQNVLHDTTSIDAKMPCQATMIEAFMGSWITSAIGLRSAKDAWVLYGLAGHFVNVYVKSLNGDEQGYRIQSAMDALTALELMSSNVDELPPLCPSETHIYAEYLPQVDEYLRIKAPLVLHLMEQRIGMVHMRTSLRKIFMGNNVVEAPPEEDTPSPPVAGSEPTTPRDSVAGDDEVEEEVSNFTDALSTNNFLLVIKSIAGSSAVDLLKTFLSSWIVNSGIPFFSVGFWYNRKQTQAEIVVKQEIPPGGRLYTGNITVSIVEDTGEFTHTKRIDRKQHKWDFPCHSKVRKKRRRRQALGEPDDIVTVTGPGMGLNDTPVYWINIDANGGWLRHVVIHQPDFNWMEQLVSDDNYLSRILAVRTLALFHQSHEKPNVMSCRAITECMSGLSTHSKRVRAEAAISLAIWQSIHAPLTCANTKLPIWAGLHNLLRIFKEHFYDRVRDILLPNYFSPSGGKVVLEGKQYGPSSIEVSEYANGEYEIKKAIPQACALLRSKNNRSPPEVEEFLLQLLQENDNSKNYVTMEDKTKLVDDAYYLGSVLLSLSHLSLDAPKEIDGKQIAVQEVLRYLRYDAVKPSYQAIISCCALEALCNLQLSGAKCDSNEISYYRYASKRYPINVRKTAIECVVRMYFGEPELSVSSMDVEHSDKIGKNSTADENGPTGAFLWVLDMLEDDDFPSIKLFAVQTLLDACKGYPPRSASQMLMNSYCAYALSVRFKMIVACPLAFVKYSPVVAKFDQLFKVASLTKLKSNCSASRDVVDRMWSLLNDGSLAYNQSLRVALLTLFQLVWGDNTPACKVGAVDKKLASWAGGYQALKLMIQESKKRKEEFAAAQEIVEDPVSVKRPANFDQFKGKKIKFKIGDEGM